MEPFNAMEEKQYKCPKCNSGLIRLIGNQFDSYVCKCGERYAPLWIDGYWRGVEDSKLIELDK